MANNVNIPAVGTGDTTPKVSTDQVTADSSQVQNVQIATVSAGVLSRVSASNPLGVAIVGTVPVSATALPLPTGAATQTTLASVLSALGTPLQAGGNVAVTSSALPSGAATETTLAAVNTKLGSALPLPTGAATETTLAAVNTKLGSALPLPTGAATQTTLAAIAGQLPAALGAHGGLVIEGVASGVAIPVTGGGTATDVSANATISATGSTTLTGLNGMSTVVLEILSNSASGVTSILEGSLDGTNWETLGYLNSVVGSTLQQTSIGSTQGVYVAPIAGFAQVRFRVAALTSGTFVINLRASVGPTWARQVNVSNTVSTTTNVTQVNGTTVVAGNGGSANALRVTLGNDSTGVVGLNAGSNVIGKVGIDQTTPGTSNLVALAANQSVNQAQVAGTAVDVNSGVKGAGTQRVVLATDQPALTNALKVDGSAVTQPVSGTVTITPSGTQTVSGTVATTSAAASQADGHSAAIGATTDAAATTTGSVIAQLRRIANLVAGTLTVSGTVTTTPPANASTNLAQVAGATVAQGHGTAATALRVELPTDGTGVVGLAAGSAAIGSVTTELTTGLTTFSNTALTSTKTAVKAGAGKVYGWMIHNPSAATTYIQVWNVAIGSITVGTTAPTWTIPIPAGASANVFTDRGITHSTEINIAATTTATGSTAPATAAVVSLFYI